MFISTTNLNTTSILQPMDQGMLDNFKTIYKSALLHKLLVSLESKFKAKQFLILKTVYT